MAPPLPPSYGYEDGEEYARRRREGYNVEQREGIIATTCIRSEGVRVSVFSGLPNLERKGRGSYQHILHTIYREKINQLQHQ